MKTDMVESLDLSYVLPKGIKFKIGKKEYELIYTFGAIKKLSEIYGSVSDALDVFAQPEDMYTTVVNFLYAGLYDKYRLSKQRIEEWVGLGSVNLLHNIIYSAVLASFGKADEANGDESGES